MMLARTNHQQEIVIAVVESITSPHIISSLKCATFVISEDILQKCVRSEQLSLLRIKYQTQGTTVKQPTKSHRTESSEYTLFTLPCHQTKPLQTGIEIEGHHLSMEIDTGAAVSIISDRTRTSLPYLENFPFQQAHTTNLHWGEHTCVRGAFGHCHLSRHQSHISGQRG